MIFSTYSTMEILKDYLDKFRHTEKTDFDNELDKLYYESMLKGQEKGVILVTAIVGSTFDTKTLGTLKTELDSYIAQRTQVGTENREIKDETQNNGFFSGIIQILNESYIYLLRYSSQQAALAVKNKETNESKSTTA